MTRLLVAAFFLVACSSVDSPTGGPDAGGTTSQCLGEDGVCGGGSPDAGTSPDAGETLDAGEALPDAGAPDAGVPCDPDHPETDAKLCARLGYDCGHPDVTDSCGHVREPSCGQCYLGEQCGAESPYVCKCVNPSTATERCAGRICGVIDGDDSCGHITHDDCGTCPEGKTCNDIGTVCR